MSAMPPVHPSGFPPSRGGYGTYLRGNDESRAGFNSVRRVAPRNASGSPTPPYPSIPAPFRGTGQALRRFHEFGGGYLLGRFVTPLRVPFVPSGATFVTPAQAGVQRGGVGIQARRPALSATVFSAAGLLLIPRILISPRHPGAVGDKPLAVRSLRPRYISPTTHWTPAGEISGAGIRPACRRVRATVRWPAEMGCACATAGVVP